MLIYSAASEVVEMNLDDWNKQLVAYLILHATETLKYTFIIYHTIEELLFNRLICY